MNLGRGTLGATVVGFEGAEHRTCEDAVEVVVEDGDTVAGAVGGAVCFEEDDKVEVKASATVERAGIPVAVGLDRKRPMEAIGLVEVSTRTERMDVQAMCWYIRYDQGVLVQ